MHKIIHYRNKCIGCGICQEQQPERWRMNKKDGKATLLKAAGKKDVFILPISNTQVRHAQEVAQACPVRVIKIT